MTKLPLDPAATQEVEQVTFPSGRVKSDEDLISVSINHISKRYGSNRKASGILANDNISLEIRQGEIFGLLGPNAAGKTTLVNQIMGLTAPTEGSILVEGLDVKQDSALVKTVTAYLPQRGLPFGSLEVRRALVYTGQLRGLSKADARSQATNLIEQLDLAEVADRLVNTLSAGMRRMVGFAATLMGRPRLLILDEPTNELDPARRRQVWEAVRAANLEHGITCLLVTHNLLEAETVLERLAVISWGRVIASGTPGELKQRFSSEAHLDLVLKPQIAALIPGPASGGSDDIAAIVTGLFRHSNSNVQVRVEGFNHQPLRLRIYFPPEEAGQVTVILLDKLGMNYLDDFRLALPSLEDVYLQLIAGVEATNAASTSNTHRQLEEEGNFDR